MRRAATSAAAARDDLDAIIRCSPVGICVVDRDGIVHVWNPAAEVSSGYAAEDVLGRPPRFVAAEDPERVAELYARALHERRTIALRCGSCTATAALSTFGSRRRRCTRGTAASSHCSRM
jgi:PAS domain-containing protein